MPEITTHHLILGALEMAVWYLFIVYLVRTIKKETGNVWISSDPAGALLSRLRSLPVDPAHRDLRRMSDS